VALKQHSNEKGLCVFRLRLLQQIRVISVDNFGGSPSVSHHIEFSGSHEQRMHRHMIGFSRVSSFLVISRPKYGDPINKLTG